MTDSSEPAVPDKKNKGKDKKDTKKDKKESKKEAAKKPATKAKGKVLEIAPWVACSA